LLSEFIQGRADLFTGSEGRNFKGKLLEFPATLERTCEGNRVRGFSSKFSGGQEFGATASGKYGKGSSDIGPFGRV